jgi:hypothetical protein
LGQERVFLQLANGKGGDLAVAGLLCCIAFVREREAGGSESERGHPAGRLENTVIQAYLRSPPMRRPVVSKGRQRTRAEAPRSASKSSRLDRSWRRPGPGCTGLGRVARRQIGAMRPKDDGVLEFGGQMISVQHATRRQNSSCSCLSAGMQTRRSAPGNVSVSARAVSAGPAGLPGDCQRACRRCAATRGLRRPPGGLGSS